LKTATVYSTVMKIQGDVRLYTRTGYRRDCKLIWFF